MGQNHPAQSLNSIKYLCSHPINNTAKLISVLYQKIILYPQNFTIYPIIIAVS